VISRETIDAIISATRIEQVIGDFVTLRRRGINLIGLCPFHNEKTPSFTVSPVKGIYKCFGCGKAGNAVNFLMEHEHLAYPEALKYLAKKYGIQIEEEEQTPEMKQELSDRERLFNLNQFARDFFEHCLHHTEEGKAIGGSYLRERGLREDIIRKFQLGYSPSSRKAFTDHALKNGYQLEFLVKSGLTIQSDDQLYDRFSSRVIFPIHSHSGRIIGFGGRILTSEKNRPKYVNSPESEIYNKSKSLYGIYFARNQIATKDICYMVEGYTDVISLHQSGIEQVVASSGTSLTVEQIRLIRRYTPNITILYDGDPAGIKASFRGIDMILEEGMNVRVVLFPEGEDPDSFSRKHHPAEVDEFITREASNFILFKTRLLLKETEGDPIRKATLIKEIVRTIALIPDGISRTLYIRECSDLMMVPEQVLMTEVNKIIREQLRKKISPETSADDQVIPDIVTVSPSQEAPVDQEDYQERELIRLLLLYGTETLSFGQSEPDQGGEKITVPVAGYILTDILRDDLSFEKPLYARIFEEYNREYRDGKTPDRNFFTGHEDPDLVHTAVDLLFTPYQLSENWARHHIIVETEEQRTRELVISALLSFKARKLDKIIAEKMKEMQEITDPEDQKRCLQQIKELKQSNILINSALGRIITK